MSEGPGTLERTMLQTGFTTGSDLLRNLRTENGSMHTTTDIPTTAPQAPNIVAIVVPIVVILGLILIGVLVFLFFMVRKKRQTEGTYRPSAEEQTGARSVEAPNALKLPKEERLI
ncbi:protein crumbs homolog 3a [Neoarius graeffei]|uniref:protein crumbs homolog 3a n=1 Tax=Neoarius graeffei TaxID=443677 RepID=UPI00298C6ABC|nr:protein crumbs homolog 3a [Neoarius graeffei]XP_060797965.1 protein crumbs homolog 3a [Neoarius graeffei]